MATARLRGPWNQLAWLILASVILGGFLGFAAAQDVVGAGFLNTDCATRCAANGYDAEFCNAVCWVPDPAQSAKADNLDWQCFQRCAKASGRAEPCLASCKRY